MSESFRIVAIDGGAASGKTSTAREVAERLKYLFVSTGLHYRLVTYHFLQKGIGAEDLVSIQDAIEELGTMIKGREALPALSGKLIAPEDLRSKEVNHLVSVYAALPVVRNSLKNYQRDQAVVARSNGFAGLIMEGRDIGTVIFPEADLKIFLTAEADARTTRRETEGLIDDIRKRDAIDSSRKAAPLQPAKDAWSIDNTNLSLEEVVEMICTRLKSGEHKAQTEE